MLFLLPKTILCQKFPQGLYQNSPHKLELDIDYTIKTTYIQKFIVTSMSRGIFLKITMSEMRIHITEILLI